jgi:hypothetical protein
VSTTYSQRFLVGTCEPFSPYIVSDPVPSGFIWVIRNVTFQQTGNFGGFMNIWIPDVSGTPESGNVALSQELYHVFGSANLWYRQVINAGEVVAAQGVSLLSAVDVIISGYQLTAP